MPVPRSQQRRLVAASRRTARAPLTPDALRRRHEARTAVREMLAAGATLHAELEREVDAQRLAGASWSAIANLLGVTKSAAYQRWRYLDNDPDARVRITRLDSGEAVASSSLTGAVVGPAQVEECRRFGLVLEHHERQALAA